MITIPDRVTVQAGTVLYNKGDKAACAYVILAGRVELRDVWADGGPDIVVRSAGETIGDLALMCDSERRMGATALTDCDLLVITREDVFERIQTMDPVLQIVLNAAVGRCSALIDKVAALPRQSEADLLSRVLPLWSSQSTAALDRLVFAHELRAGLGRGELELFFQPIVRLDDGKLAGFETLIRWHHPVRGLLMPDAFIPLAESSGVITDVTMFCLRRVGQQMPAMQAMATRNPRGVERLFLTVNVSGLDLAQSAFASQAVSVLWDAGIEPEDVKLEVTESTVMSDAERCVQTLRNCRDQGFEIAIDDFGTGYSSLHYLNTMPITVLKLDRSFSASLLVDTAGRKIIEAIVQLSRELNLAVVAEGVETAPHVAALRQMGCCFGQGYFFGAAVAHGVALQTIRDWVPADRLGLQAPMLPAA